MSCGYNNKCGKLCSHFVITTAVAFADGTLTLTLPDDVTYGSCEKFCLVIGQALPDTVTLNAPVVAVIGAGTTTFPLITCCGAPVVAQQISTRRRYETVVTTTPTGGSFKVLSPLPCVESTTLNALNEA